MLPNFTVVVATSLRHAITELRKPGARLFAGGTDMLALIREDVERPSTLVAIADLKELAGIRATSDGGVTIGALTTLAELAASSLLRERYAALAQAASAAASPQLRNQGTLGGNLCQRPRCWYFRGGFPCVRRGGDTCFAFDGENQFHSILGGERCYAVHPSDTAPALLALGGRLALAGPGGRRLVGADAFFVPPAIDPTRETVLTGGEILTEVLLPAPNGVRSAFRKVRPRAAWDFALASAAVALRLDGRRVAEARVALGGVAPVPWRAQAAERVLAGTDLNPDSCAKAAKSSVAGAAPLAGNGYKLALAKGLVVEVLETLRDTG